MLWHILDKLFWLFKIWITQVFNIFSTQSQHLVHVKFVFSNLLPCYLVRIRCITQITQRKDFQDLGGSVTSYSDTPNILSEAGNYNFIMQNPLTLMQHAARSLLWKGNMKKIKENKPKNNILTLTWCIILFPLALVCERMQANSNSDFLVLHNKLIGCVYDFVLNKKHRRHHYSKHS